MIRFILNGGPFAILQSIITIFLFLYIIQVFFSLFGKSEHRIVVVNRSIKISKNIAVFILGLGITGQVLGLVYALKEISAATAISPKIIVQGLMISFHSTLLGLIVFIITYLSIIAMQLVVRKEN